MAHRNSVRPHHACIALFLLCLSSLSLAQKRPIAAKDFDSWRTLTGQVLSPDGHYVAYALFPLEGDGDVVIRNLATGKESRESAGELPPPPPEDPNAEGPTPPRSIQLSFSNDSKTLVFLAYPTHAEVANAKAEKQTDKRAPAHEALVVVDLASTKATRVPNVKSFQLPKKADGFVAYLKFPATPFPAPASENSTEAESSPAPARATGPSRETRRRVVCFLFVGRFPAPSEVGVFHAVPRDSLRRLLGWLGDFRFK